jgi:ACS family sodium-dependent inorganic phosphate cotransporter-like MFS transporter 5
MIFSSSRPENNRFISSKEREYIEKETKESMRSLRKNEDQVTPWLKIMTSGPALAIFFGHSCSNWGTYLFLTSLPMYMKEILEFDVTSVNMQE